jgi:hypothetical protein
MKQSYFLGTPPLRLDLESTGGGHVAGRLDHIINALSILPACGV